MSGFKPIVETFLNIHVIIAFALLPSLLALRRCLPAKEPTLAK